MRCGRGCGTWVPAAALVADATAEVNQVRDLLECAWPAVLGAAGVPFRSATWRAALAVALDRCVGDLARGAPAGARPGVRPRCAVGCPTGAPGARACGSCARCSRPLLILPA